LYPKLGHDTFHHPMLDNGTVLGRYMIVEPVAASETSFVYRAKYADDGAGPSSNGAEWVCVKELRQTSGISQESRASLSQVVFDQGEIQHANIVKVHDLLAYEDLLYLVTEWLDGPSLRDVINEQTGPWTQNEVLGVMEPILAGLEVAHESGLAHGNLTPDNIILTPSHSTRSPGKPVLTEFGVKALLNTGTYNTPYLAPEQNGVHNVPDTCSDVYGAGMWMWRLFTGTLPVDPEDDAQVAALYDGSVRMPDVYGSGEIDEVIQEAIAGALAIDPEERPQDATDLLDALEYGYDEREGPEPQPLLPIPEVPPGRSWLMVAVTAALVFITYLSPLGPGAPQQALAGPDHPAPAAPKGASTSPDTSSAILARGVASTEKKSQGTEGTSTEMSAAPDGVATPDGMTTIAAGTYVVGCAGVDSDCLDDEQPEKTVQFKGFAVQTHEVTAVDFDSFVNKEAGPTAEQMRRQRDDAGLACNWARNAKRDRHPINCITWEQAKAYCEHNGWRLPTEEEWEVAARGPKRATYPWGEDRPNCRRATIKAPANPACAGNRTRTVGAAESDRSWFGIVDMMGNVQEWTSSTYTANYRDKTAADVGGNKVIRGGSYELTARQLGNARTRYPQEEGRKFHPTIGFRCAVDL
jgi:formylglycine-generating enzyme required for sulfatase activity